MLRKKQNIKSIIITIIVILLVLILGFSIYKIITWFIDSNRISEQLNIIEEETTINEVVDNKDTEIIESITKPEPFDPYWDYIKMNLINVDFNNLEKINKYTAGWIQVNGTNINYPFVQGDNNEYFLKYDFYNKKNSAGWIFMDYRNTQNDFDKNTILYGHSRKDTTMFGTLKNILSNGWYDNKDNHIVKLSTKYENTLWQVFSVYHIPETSDYIKVNFKDNNEYQEFLNMIIKRTRLKFNTNVEVTDKILTLSTCYNNDERVVLHAKLIKRNAR